LPANRHAFTDNPLPKVVITDSSFIFESLIDAGQGRHRPARDFAERLRKANVPLVYSSLLFIEAPQCWRRLYARGVLRSTQKGIDPISDRINAFGEADVALNNFLAAFDRREIKITKRLMNAASELVARFHLSAHDAIVIAVSIDTGITDIVAIDNGFKRVDGIELWDGLLLA